MLNSLGGGCQVPIGAFAEMRNGKLHLESIVADPDGSKLLRDSRDGDDPEKLGNAAGAACWLVAETRSSKPSTAVAWPCLRNLDRQP